MAFLVDAVFSAFSGFCTVAVLCGKARCVVDAAGLAAVTAGAGVTRDAGAAA